MITLKDIEKILISDFSSFFDLARIYVTDDCPEGVIKEERLVIRVGRNSIETYFNKTFVNVNWAVPDLGDRPDHARLEEAERTLSQVESTGVFNDTAYRYEVDSVEILGSELECHYVNVRLLFEILNTR